jgi:anhydro-N-acetylmuramic acid kinase
MSGSSLDGLDMATVEFNEEDGFKWRIVNCRSYSLDDSLRRDLSNALNCSVRDIALLQNRYSRFIAERIKDFENEFQDGFEYCSIHGHSLLHDIEFGHSWQLLNAGQVSGLANKHVVADFRNQDMAKGGIGTPMAALVDRDLFKEYRYCINLGGIANISYTTGDKEFAYDIAPCNQVHNYFAQKLGFEFDEGGLLAREVEIDQVLFEKLLALAAAKKIPKAIDNSWIHKVWIPMLESSPLNERLILRTHYSFLVQLISDICTVEGSKLLLTGGGAKNVLFVELLEDKLKNSLELHVPEEKLIDNKEAVLMAYMAYKRIRKEANFIGECTGADSNVCAGAIYYCNTIK